MAKSTLTSMNTSCPPNIDLSNTLVNVWGYTRMRRRTLTNVIYINIELKKAERKVRRAQKALDAAETDEEKKKHEQELEESKIDQLYIQVTIVDIAFFHSLILVLCIVLPQDHGIHFIIRRGERTKEQGKEHKDTTRTQG